MVKDSYPESHIFISSIKLGIIAFKNMSFKNIIVEAEVVGPLSKDQGSSPAAPTCRGNLPKW